MTYEDFIALPTGRVLRRETIQKVLGSQHVKHVIVGVVRVVKCDTCDKRCIAKSVQTQTMGNKRIATLCMVCSFEEYI